MKRILKGSLCLAVFVVVTGCASSYGQTYHQSYEPTYVRASMRSPGVDVSYFYDNLAPYGDWFQDPSYGWCWTPYDVSASWRPYYDGHWAYTDYGWSWVSNEPWGWATYHYGRWFFDDSYGWVWVPGTDWAPAWVAWRSSDDWVGWAPLPPAAGWDVSGGLVYDDQEAIPSQEWCFVPHAHVLDVNIRVQVTSVARNVTLIDRCRDATRYDVVRGRPSNLGLDVVEVERRLHRPVPRWTIIDVDAPTRGGGQPMGRGAVGFFRPAVRPAPSAPVSAPVVAEHRSLPDEILQRRRDEQQRRLENDLHADRARLARDEQNELRAPAPGSSVDEIRKRHAAEQQAFEEHAARQRQVLAQRIQRQIVKPGKAKHVANLDDQGGDKAKDKEHDKGDK
jgi:hypothetical protein